MQSAFTASGHSSNTPIFLSLQSPPPGPKPLTLNIKPDDLGTLPPIKGIHDIPVAREVGFDNPVSVMRCIVSRWMEQLKGSGFSDTRWVLGGSVACGNFWGPKEALQSSNPDKPTRFRHVVECDGRFLLPEGLHPHDPKVIAFFEQILNGRARGPEICRRWNREEPVTRIYTYAPLGGELGLEFEISLVRNTFLEVAQYWKSVFSPEEIETQRVIRACIGDWGLGKDTMRSEKNVQCLEARWRVVAGYALNELLICNKIDFGEDHKWIESDIRRRFGGEPPIALKPIIEQWLLGHEKFDVEGLFRPKSLPCENAKAYLDVFWPELLDKKVSPPLWVTAAIAVHRELSLHHSQQ